MDELVADDTTAHVNGHKVSKDGARSGQKLLTNALHYYDQNVENPFWQLYEEVDQDLGHGNRSIAIRFVANGEFDGEHREIEMAELLE